MVSPSVPCIRVPFPEMLKEIRQEEVVIKLTGYGFFVAKYMGDTFAYCDSSSHLVNFLDQMGAKAVRHEYDCTKEK